MLFSGKAYVRFSGDLRFLFAAACLGYPSRSVSNAPQALGCRQTKVNRLQAWDALRYDALPVKSACFIAERHFLDVWARTCHRPFRC